MNDRFKFRVWNKLTHSFTTGGAIKFGGLCFIDEEDFGIKLGEHQECYIIEQCTGLKDKNGNLIYEGDFIKVPRVSDEIMRVVFNEYCFECFYKDTNEYILSLSVVNTVARSENIEIIGNIHTGIKGE